MKRRLPPGEVPTMSRTTTAAVLGATLAGIGGGYVVAERAAEPSVPSIDKFVNSFAKEKSQATKAGYEYWFVDKDLADDRKTVKMSVVGPRLAAHAPHRHLEDEVIFVLEGSAELMLAGQTRVVGPLSSLYCPPNVEHGIKNAGDSELKYLIIKRAPEPAN